MTTAAPTILTLETDSTWVVILVVSFVTLVLTLLLRRIIGRPGGLASSVLLAIPLLLPLVAAVIFQGSLLPEFAVLRRRLGPEADAEAGARDAGSVGVVRILDRPRVVEP